MKRRPLIMMLGVLHLLTACYAYVPVRAPAVGAQLALEVNDEGRVALGQALGPGVVRVEGRLAAMEGDAYVLLASSVTQLRSMAMPLEGLRVRVSQGHVVRLEERQLSRTRTWMTIGVAVAVVASFFLSKGVFGRSTPPEEPGGPPGPDQ